MKAVILAAGLGTRFNNEFDSQPKPLVQLLDKPLIAYTLEALEEVDVEDILVVTGYRGEEVRDAVKNSCGVHISGTGCIDGFDGNSFDQN